MQDSRQPGRLLFLPLFLKNEIPARLEFLFTAHGGLFVLYSYLDLRR
jgi:hypothetical protein